MFLFSLWSTAVFCTGARDGNIMVWDTRCSKKGIDFWYSDFTGQNQKDCYWESIWQSLWLSALVSSSQMVSTDKLNKSLVLIIKQSQTHPLKWRRDGAPCEAWLPVWWVSLIVIDMQWTNDQEGEETMIIFKCFIFDFCCRTPSRASQ